MLIFQGEYRHSFDSKGRISLPSKMRIEASQSWVITKGPDRSLLIYPAPVWQRIIKNSIAGLNQMVSDNRIFIRTFVSPAVESKEDKLGRINVPQNLQDFAEIEKEAVFLGSIHRIELFSIKNYLDFEKDPEKYIEEKRSAYERITEKMTQAGF